MKNTFAIAAVSALLLSGCATAPKDIAAAYVSPTGYQAMTCAQLQAEAQAVSGRAVAAAGAQDKKVGSDAALMTVGVILFWPAALFIKGDGAQAAEISRLKGEMVAIEQVNRAKSCGIQFSPGQLPG